MDRAGVDAVGDDGAAVDGAAVDGAAAAAAAAAAGVEGPQVGVVEGHDAAECQAGVGPGFESGPGLGSARLADWSQVFELCGTHTNV